MRDQIQQYDDNKGHFLGTKKHPVLGYYDSSHVPLARLEAHFPDVFETIRALDVYAILRDPVARFSSSLAQRFRQIHKVRPDQATSAQIDVEVDAVIAHLEQMTGFPNQKFSHFSRQSDFILFEDQKMVRNPYTIDETPVLIRALSGRLGVELVEGFHANKTVTFRHEWIARPAIFLKD